MNNANEIYMYRVCILRQGITEPLYVYDSDVLVDAEKCYQELDKEWITSVEEKRPFRLREPFITSFTPGLLTEIKIDKIPLQEYQQSQNPYNQQMQEQGFTGFMQKNFKG